MRKKLFILIFFLNLSTSFADGADEYKLKAVFIERFSCFINWNESLPLETTLQFAIVGNSNVTKKFSVFFQTKKFKNKKIKIFQVKELGDLSNADIIFITKDANFTTKEISAAAKNSTLIIGDLPDMAENGAIISFIIKNKKLRFRINIDNAKKRHIKISSYLLEMAEIVDSTTTDGGGK